MKMKNILTLLCLLPFTSGFGQNIYDSMYVGNRWRTFMTHLPTGYNSNTIYPLILGFHGGQQAATSAQGWSVFAYQSKLSEKSDSAGFIVVYPEGVVINQNRSWNAGDCCPPAMNQQVDDVGFINQLLDSLFSHYSIDSTRVYATGSSNGGMLCYRLACELSHRFAAIAPNACSQMYSPCNPQNKIPIISFHSQVDPIVSYVGGMGGAPPLTNVQFPSQDSILQFWSQRNNCQTRDTIINGNGMNYTYINIHNCACQTEIHHYATSDGSHSWPGGNPNNNPVSMQLSATYLLWEFFQNYTLGCINTSLNIMNQLNPLFVYPNPANTKIEIKNVKAEKSFAVFNTMGQTVLSGTIANEIDIARLPKGVYYLRITNENASHVARFIKE